MDDNKEKTEGKEESKDRSLSDSSNFIPSVSPKDQWLRDQILKTRLKKKKKKETRK